MAIWLWYILISFKDRMKRIDMDANRNVDLDSIRAYYDHNTPRFLSYGKQRRTGTIHRSVWGDGVNTGAEALHYVHDLIIEVLRADDNPSGRQPRVLDLGCGVGASLFYLANNLDGGFSGVGLTISRVQVRMAREIQPVKDPEKKCKFVLGDFLRPPLGTQFDLIYAVESFAHAVDPLAFFNAAARTLKPGGKLVLCDDFLTEKANGGKLSNRQEQWLKIFQNGWRVDGLWRPDYVENLARDEGLELIKEVNLTPYLRIKPLPIFIIEFLSAGIRVLPGKNLYLRSVIGGQALKLCLLHKIVEYRFLVFEKVPG
jgi:SAM-dependent methyltransferase